MSYPSSSVIEATGKTLIEFRGNKFLAKNGFRKTLISCALLDIVKGGG